MVESPNIAAIIREAEAVVAAMKTAAFQQSVQVAGELLQRIASNRQTVFITGNGGSWADADHFAGELRAQFEVAGGPAFPALALPVSLTSQTAWGNDYPDGFAGAIGRDLEALAKPGDCLIAISTSGKAVNVRRALVWAKSHGLETLAISGNGPSSGDFGALASRHIIIPHERTARIQEGYQLVIHLLCAYVDKLK